ncbi:MAG: glutaredoxin family protein [Dehalococcoidia bacterium]
MMTTTHSVLLYTKEGCPLCEEARRMLSRLGRRYPMRVTEVDIASDEALLRRYRDTIPVIEVDGVLTLGGRIDEAELREWLEETP